MHGAIFHFCAILVSYFIVSFCYTSKSGRTSEEKLMINFTKKAWHWDKKKHYKVLPIPLQFFLVLYLQSSWDFQFKLFCNLCFHIKVPTLTHLANWKRMKTLRRPNGWHITKSFQSISRWFIDDSISVIKISFHPSIFSPSFFKRKCFIWYCCLSLRPKIHALITAKCLL